MAKLFARAWLSRGRFRDEAEGSALRWLFGIANNVLRDSLRKRADRRRRPPALGLPTVVEVDLEYETVDERLSLPEAALRALTDLPDAERELLWLRVVEERPYREIAARLRCSPAVARLRVSRALRRLQLSLGGN